jgi:hypothetical protein
VSFVEKCNRERVVTACVESQSTSRDLNRTCFLAVHTTISVKMKCDKKSLLTAVNSSKKHNLMAVEGHEDNTVNRFEKEKI